MSISANYNIIASFYRPVNVGTDFKPQYDWILDYEVDGLLDMENTRNHVRSEGETIRFDARLYCDVVDINKTYRVLINGHEYTIYSVHNPNYMDRHLEVLLLNAPQEVVENDS